MTPRASELWRDIAQHRRQSALGYCSPAPRVRPKAQGEEASKWMDVLSALCEWQPGETVHGTHQHRWLG
jgi:hypothetical protein